MPGVVDPTTFSKLIYSTTLSGELTVYTTSKFQATQHVLLTTGKRCYPWLGEEGGNVPQQS